VVTAQQIERGGSLAISLLGGDSYQLSGTYGAPRLVEVTAEADCSIIMPDARLMRGGVGHFTIYNAGGNSVAVYLRDGAGQITGYTDIAAGYLWAMHVRDNSTQNGSWVVQEFTSYAKGSSLTTARQPLVIIVEQTLANPDLSTLAYLRGWDGQSPVAMTLTVNSTGLIKSGDSAIVGTPSPALRIEGWPTGSTFLLVNFGKIIGRGGAGGNGGPFVTATNGQAAGHAIQSSHNLGIANFGTIGGGGGGGAGQGTGLGGAGGGGAGLEPGQRGNASTAPAVNQGQNGTETLGGLGGGTSTPGGTGGVQGAAGGNSASLTGGAAGKAVHRIGSPTITTIRNLGTINGAIS